MLPGNPRHVRCATILSLVVVKAGGWRLEAGVYMCRFGSYSNIFFYFRALV
jgi:hypothetical protein